MSRCRTALFAFLVAGLGFSLAAAPTANADPAPAPASGVPATVTADALPTVQINGIVWAQVTVGNIVYIVVAADVDAGLIDNTATAHGVDPIVADIVSNSSSARATTLTPLAMTGVDSRLDLIVAGLLLSTGALLVLAGRRRRS